MNSENVISVSHAPRALPSAEHEQAQARVHLDDDHLAQPNGFSRNGTPIIEPWIGVDELALVLHVSTDWVYEKAASGELPSYKFGGHRRFRVSEVEDWASKCASGKMLHAGTQEARRR